MSLAQPPEPVDVNTRAGNTSATPLADLSLKPDTPASTSSSSSVVDDAFASSSSGMTGGAGTARARAHDSDPLDLPLFGPTPHSVGRDREFERGREPERGRDRDSFAGTGAANVRDEMRERRDLSERPLVNPAPPRPPLAVRRPTGDVPRARARVTPTQPLPMGDEPRLELDPPERERERARDRDRERDLGRDRGARGASGISAGTTSTSAPSSSSTAPGAAASDEPLALGFDMDVDGDADVAGVSREASSDVSRASSSSLGFGFAPDAASSAAASSSLSSSAEASSAVPAAPLVPRAIAALIDFAFLAAVDATVLHFTLRLTGLTWTLANISLLPLAPLGGFLALLNGGYLAMFTAASGQTMGKMMTGVKVVSMRGEAVPFGHAVLRAILWLLTIVPAGVGFIPALLTDDRRALHDRLADTRVVKAD